ncbi:MAG: hypothetical protein JW882_17295, partial [Deltaproteobacteria bacterium]|nr:hypothetical protein [Deltaproteobacteria bacterium]
QYVYDGNNLELDQLFSRTDMTKKALVYLNQVPSLISDFNDIGDNVVKLREFLDAKRTGSRARVLVEISHSAQKEVATELWNMFKRLVSLCMGKYTLGLVAASKVLFSVFPEEAQPIDNAEWRNVFKTIDFIAFHLTAYHKGEKAGITFVLNLPVTGMPPEAIINDGLFTQDRYNRPVEHDAAKIERAQKKLFLSIVRELGLTLQRENPQKARLY